MGLAELPVSAGRPPAPRRPAGRRVRPQGGAALGAGAVLHHVGPVWRRSNAAATGRLSSRSGRRRRARAGTGGCHPGGCVSARRARTGHGLEFGAGRHRNRIGPGAGRAHCPTPGLAVDLSAQRTNRTWHRHCRCSRGAGWWRAPADQSGPARGSLAGARPGHADAVVDIRHPLGLDLTALLGFRHR
jgi:hypothetical protein